MLRWAVIFLVVALVAAFLGFGGIAGGATQIAMILFYIFLAITVILVYCVVNFIIQSVLQPKFVGDAVGLTTTVSFLSLVVWAFILGPIGAILAIPASLLVKAILVDMDPAAKWLELFLGDKPTFDKKPRRKSRANNQRDQAPPADDDTGPAVAAAGA